MEEHGPKANDKPGGTVATDPGQTSITVNVHLYGATVARADEVRQGSDSYARLKVGQEIGNAITVFVHDPDHLRQVARVAMASALRLERLLEAAKATPDTDTITDADVDAALAEVSVDA